MCIRLFYKYLTSVCTELTHVCTLCATNSIHKVHHCTCITTSLNASSTPFPFVCTDFSSSFCCSVLHIISLSFILNTITVLQPSYHCLCHCLCFVPVCVRGHQPSSLIQHLNFVALQLLNHFILSVPLVRPLYWSVLCNPQL